MTRRVLASVFIAAAAFALLARAEPTDPPKDAKKAPEKEKLDVKLTAEDLAAKQIRMQALYSDFKGALLRLSQRMANSPKPEDRERAKLLKQALEKANEEGIDNSFDKLVTILKAAKPDDQAGFTKALNETDDLSKRLRAILALLMTDNRDAELKKQITEATRRLEELKRIIREQDTALTKTELNRGTKKTLKEGQQKITGDTKNLADGKGKGKDNPGAEAKGKPGDSKGEGKPGEAKAAGKNDTPDAKGDKKDPKAGEPKPGTDPKKDAKGEAKDQGKGDPKKDGQKGEAKDQGKGDPKDQKADPKDAGKQSPNDPKKGEQKDSKGDSKGKADGKGEGKPSDSKPMDSPPSQSKPSQKPAEGRRRRQEGPPAAPGRPAAPQEGRSTRFPRPQAGPGRQ